MFYLCLVIQLEPELVDPTFADTFQRFGIKTFFVGSFEAAKELLAQMLFDAIVLDDGRSSLANTVGLLKELSRLQSPTFLVRDACSDTEQIQLHEAGAWEIVARATSTQLTAMKLINAAKATRVSRPEPELRLFVGPLRLDALATTATLDDVPLPLTPKQFDLLFLLATREGKLVHRSALERIMGHEEGGRALDMQLCRLRRCLREAGGDSVSILAIYGFGYSLNLRRPARQSERPQPKVVEVEDQVS